MKSCDEKKNKKRENNKMTKPKIRIEIVRR